MSIRSNIADLPTETDKIGRSVPVDDASHYLEHDQIVGQQRKSVLVVDDESTVRLLIAEVLADLNYASLEATDGPSGLLILQSEAPIGLLITDVGLPGGMSGRHLASAARLARPGLAILFITGYAEAAAIGDDVLEPRTMVLTKPFSIDALTSSITELMT